VKVSIKNFQSIEDCEVKIDGLTVLVGKSNIGKSAVIRAIQGALTNREGEDFVTEGKDHTEVHLQTDKLDLLWKKGGDFNDYTINGEALEKVGRGAPPHIAESGFGEIEAGRESISVQIADQFHPLFLLNASGSVAAEAISDVGRLTDLQTALRNCDKDRREVRSTRKVRKTDLAATQDELTHYDDYKDDMKQVDEVKAYYAEVGQIRAMISDLEWLEGKRATFVGRIDTLTGVDSVSIPEWEGDSIQKEIDTLSQLEARRLRTEKTLTQYEGIDDITIPVWDDEGLLSQIHELDSFETRSKRLKAVLDAGDGLEDLEVPVIDLDALATELAMLEAMASKLEAAVGQIPALKKAILELDAQIEASQTEVHDILHDAGQCPTCEQEVV